MNATDPRLERLLGGVALAALRQRLRKHFERQVAPENSSVLHLGQLNAAEREAIALLMSRPVSSARSARVDIAVIDGALRSAGVCDSLRDALERLDGPIIERAGLRAATGLAWSALTHAPGRDARLHAWLQAVSAQALLKRLSRQDAAAAERLLAWADAVLRRLPASGIARAQLAAEVLGNAHALDAGQPVATVVLAVWRHSEAGQAQDAGVLTDLEEPAGGDAQTLDERARDVWSRSGVLVNELARPALVLNLPTHGVALCVPGEPAYLSLRRLMRDPPSWAVEDRDVFVCENPNLLAIAADQLGASCAPLVCTDGMPAAAQRTLLSQLAKVGARLHYHGDFDWPGVQIANHVLRQWRAKPWRMGAEDYEAAVRGAPHTERDWVSSDLVAVWDSQLAPAMCLHGLAMAEEAVAGLLLEDLRLI